MMSDETWGSRGPNDPSSNEEPPKSRMDMNGIARKMSGGNKTAGIVIAICMVVIGVLILLAPYTCLLYTSYPFYNELSDAAGALLFGPHIHYLCGGLSRHDAYR